MEKTLAVAGRSIDSAASVVGQTAVALAGTAVDTATRLGRNVANRTAEHGVLGVIFAPIPCLLYGAVAGAVDTANGR